MLSAARNEMLTRVGPDTPMGNLLRRYWMPVAGASELAQNRIKPMRLMGEDLVLYKDLGGRYGLVARHRSHRGAGILRDAKAASCVALPDIMRKYNVEGVPLADYDKHPLLRERLAGFRHHFGQPAQVRRAFVEAMGIGV